MQTFRDMAGRTWTLVINVAAVKRCRALAGVDLYGLADDGFKGFADLMADPVRLVDTLYVLCEAEAASRNVSDVQFGEAMAGDAILHAAHAFAEELVDFFPDPRRRAAIRRVIEMGNRVADRMLEAATTQLDAVDVDSIATRLIATPTGSPGSSASTPGPSPSGN